MAAGCGRWVPLADGTAAKALTGIDDHSRFCVSTQLMPRERRSACDVLVGNGLLQFWIGNELIRTTVRASTGEIRKKRGAGTTASAR